VSHPIHTVARADPGYPAALRQVKDAPACLHVLGSLPRLDRAVAIVGARAASGRAQASAREIAAALGNAGIAIVSGGAIGIDAAAHRGALDVGAPTIAVLGGGLDHMYPARNRPLFGQILAAGGAVASPFADHVEPRPGCFVRRNRVIAAMAEAVVVIEAGPGSGALHTARAASEYGRLVGALPGSPGCEALIAQGAAVVESAADLEAALGGAPRRPVVEVPEPGSDEARVLGELVRRGDAVGEDELAASLGMSASAAARALTGLELEGLALLLPGRSFVLSALARELLAP
jgi:DNA processing protein